MSALRYARPTSFASVLVGFLVLTAGCTTTPPADGSSASGTTTDARTDASAEDATDGASTEQAPTDTRTKRADGHPALDSRLNGLLDAENRSTYATNRGLRVRNGSVLVVVELHENASLPDEVDVTVEVRHENLVQAWVPIDQLRTLADHENVRFVRPPHEAVPDSPSEETTET